MLALIEARFPPGTHETYQVPLGLRPADEGWGERVIAEADGWTVYDALADPAHGARAAAPHALRRRRARRARACSRFRWAGRRGASLGGTVDVRPVGVEQSNSSIVFGEALILKAFRRVEPGVNPELELLRFLSARGFPHIAPLAGWYEYEGRLIDATLGDPAGVPGGRARRLGARARRARAATPRRSSPSVRALGVVTGELHTALGSEARDPAFAPDEPSDGGALDPHRRRSTSRSSASSSSCPRPRRSAPIRGRGQDVRERLQLLSHIGAGGRVIRTHGDLHLGQTMLADRGWVILDFEGEPARPLPERRLKRSPLRDVAGMLRSFSYAAAGSRHPARRRRRRRTGRTARGDASSTATSRPSTPRCCRPASRRRDQLLAVFELEKAVYELRYELNNRPDWVAIPVAGIARLLESNGGS